ncbi:Cupredoxin [Syncephalis plumigaleata]|nr:Cupredoxin [Syncephalis plumigaleata]
MKLLALSAITALILPAASVWAANTTEVNVGYRNYNIFYSDNVTVSVGDTVKWVLNSGRHSVVEGEAAFSCKKQPGGFDSKELTTPNSSYSYTFIKPGTYWYFSGVGDDCQQKMLGVVYVTSASDNKPSTPANTTTPTNPDGTSAASGYAAHSTTTLWLVGGILAAGAMLL